MRQVGWRVRVDSRFFPSLATTKLGTRLTAGDCKVGTDSTMAISIFPDLEEARISPEWTPGVLHLPELKTGNCVHAKADYNDSMSKWIILVPLVVPVVTKMPILTVIANENSICVKLEVSSYFHGGHNGVPVQENVLDISLRVLVPRSQHVTQHHGRLLLVVETFLGAWPLGIAFAQTGVLWNFPLFASVQVRPVAGLHQTSSRQPLHISEGLSSVTTSKPEVVEATV